MKFKLLLTLAFTGLLFWAASSQNVQLFSENFESGGGSFFFNQPGVGTNTGNNLWLVNNSYTGNAIASNTISEDSTYGGTISFAPFGHYLHVYDQTSGANDCSYNPVNQSDRFSYIWNGICTLDAYNVSLNFFYMGEGSANAYGTVYYSRNNGPWIQCGAAQYNAKYKWQYTTITDPGFDNVNSLRIGFRWQNTSVAGSDTSSLGIDDISVVGTYDTIAHPVHITCNVFPDTICAGGGGVLNLSFTTSDTLCYGTYLMILSDSNGNFVNSPAAWNVSMGYPFNTAGPFSLNIPANVPPGHCYKFIVNRVSDPAVNGIASGCIYIENCPTTITTMQPLVTSDPNNPVCAGSVIQVPFNSIGTYGNTNVYFAELSDSSGSFASPDTIASLVSNSAYPSLPPGVCSGLIPFSVPAGCHYYIRVVSDTPHSIGTTFGPFCIQHCDIWTDTATTSLQACVKSCYRDPGGFNITVPYDTHKYDTNQHYFSNNDFKVQLLSTQTFGVVATGAPFGVYLDSVSGTMTVHVPCGDSVCSILGGPGSYYLRLVATHSNQPDSMLGTLIFLNIGYPQDSLNIIPVPTTTTFCVGDAPDFYAYPISFCTNNWFGGSTYQWYYNNVIINGINQAYFGLILNGAGNGTLMVRETNNGCKGPLDTIKLTIKGLPSDNITGPLKFCKGDTGFFSVPFTNNTYYKWRLKNAATIDTANNVLKAVFDTTGSFFIEIIAIDSCGADSSSKRVTVVAQPNAKITGPNVICKGSPVTLTASGGTSYTWSPNVDLTCTNCATTTANPPATQQYIVSVSNGTCKVNDTIKLVVKPLPSDTGCCDQTINLGQSANLSVMPGNINETYSWVPSGSLNCSTCINPIATPSVTTTYTLTITDTTDGCTMVDTVLVVVRVPARECDTVWVPTAFSPNGDGQNDVLKVRGGCITELDFVVFDRWGNKVFETQDQTIGWNGKYNGQPMNTGTFVYYLKAVVNKSSGLESITQKGNVTLVR